MKTHATGLVAVLAAMASLLLAQPSSAAPTVPKGANFTLNFPDPAAQPKPLGPVCDFPVLIEGSAAQLQRAALPNGLLVIAGAAVATVTNTTTGESATYNISGPYKYNPATNGVTVYGTNLIFGPEGDSGPPDERKFLWLTTGTMSFTFGQPVFEDALRGRIIDVCAELAG